MGIFVVTIGKIHHYLYSDISVRYRLYSLNTSITNTPIDDHPLHLVLSLLSGNRSSADAQLALGLQSHDAAAPLLALGVLGGEGLLKGVQRRLVLGVHARQTHARSRLLVHQRAQSRLAFHDRVRHAHLVAQSGQPHHQLQGIHVVGNQHQLRLLLLHQLRHVVQTVLHHEGSALLLSGLALSLGLRLRSQTSLLLRSRLGSILCQQAEQLRSLVLLQRVLELVHGGRNLQALRQNLALSLQDHVAGPLHETGQIGLVLQGSRFGSGTIPSHHRQSWTTWESQRTGDSQREQPS